MSCTNCDPQPCDCPVKDLGTDCSVYNQDENLDQISSPKGTILSVVLQNINSSFKNLKESLGAYFQVANSGIGAAVYQGVNGLGVKIFRGISEGSNTTVSENENDITVDVPDASEIVKGAIQIATQDEANAGTISTKSITPLTLAALLAGIGADGSETIINEGSNITITGTGTAGDPYVINAASGSVPDGSETIVTQGSNATVTGTGTSGDPYVINSTDNDTIADGSETIVNQGTNVTITGTGTSGDPYVINSSYVDTVSDGSETIINQSGEITVSGSGTSGDPYIIGTANLQKTISANYTLTPADNNYTIIINNGVTAISITVPTSLGDAFNAGFIQQGTGEVDFLASGTTVNSPSGLKIKGQYYNAFLEKVGVTEVLQLLGNLKV